MTRQHRSLPSIALACALVPAFISVPLTFAQQQPVAAAPAAAADEKIHQAADDFWHYAKIARYDLANQAAQNILTQYKDQGPEVLKAFNAVSSDRGDNLDQWILRWQQTPDLRESVNQLIALINQGRAAHRSDIAFIQQNIERLSTNERAYTLGLQQLRQSGELAVPVMIDYLRDPNKKEFQSSTRRALIDMGRIALNPLVAATEMQDTDTLITVIDALGNIGYDVSVPYLLHLASDSNRPGAVQSAATQALVRMGVADPKSMKPAESFYDLSEKFYYGQAAVTAPQGSDVAFVWYWDNQNGLTKKNVPSPIFNDLMAMRTSEYALKLDANMSKAVSLWIASNFKREADLPQGATDTTRGENQPDAHYYAVASGVQFLNPVLARALRDHNSAVAFKTIKALEVTAGSSSLFSGQAGQPVIDALSFPDRSIRFEAAYAIGSALPQADFQGKDRTVQILADALNNTGKPTVLALFPSQNDVNTLSEALGAQMTVVGSTTAAGAIEQSQKLAGVDYILISEDLPDAEVNHLIDAANASPRLDGAARIILTHSPASRYAPMTINNPMVSLTQATPADPNSIKAALIASQQKAGAMSMDEATSAANALRSAQLMAKLAMAKGQVMDLSQAQPALLSALSAASPDLVRAVGDVLSQLNSKDAQIGLLNKSLDEKTADDLKISLLGNLATNAKFYGNQLDEPSIVTLEKAVHDAANLQVRSAAAEARGALNLPADQAKKLILEQSKV
ncbi:MAG TPA: HEAT repeat domain-containing protein [Tepidisphaeraceae bacterium]|nr:HEAT repeat domain-containing protein [Tepidisphaeraceae bacterium]